LSDGAGQLVPAVSVFGRLFTVQQARLVRREPVDLFPLVEEAMTDFLAEDADGGLVFAHDPVRQAVYGLLTRGRREHLHRKVATIARDAGGLVRSMPAETARVARPRRQPASCSGR
jgi:hypothetical protein